jgi:hypothetical protein
VARRNKKFESRNRTRIGVLRTLKSYAENILLNAHKGALALLLRLAQTRSARAKVQCSICGIRFPSISEIPKSYDLEPDSITSEPNQLSRTPHPKEHEAIHRFKMMRSTEMFC